MKALICKEFRENLKVTVLALVVLVLIILMKYRDYTWSLEHLYLSRDTQPLMSSGFVDLIQFFCAVFGGILGWLQVWNERHRDLWAFLVHRPLTRTQLFFGKILAGLSIYFVVPGLLLFGCVVWVAVPGHVPAPFEWQMVLPLAVAFLAGIVYYFAGMLTGLRQARWYASRCLGLAVAVLVSVGVSSANQFWQALLYLVGSTAILSVAVWGAFHSDGHYEGQPASGKAALATALSAGLAILVFVGTLMLAEFVFRLGRIDTWSNYFMTTDGAIYKETTRNGGASRSIEPVENAKAERPPNRPDNWQRQSGTVPINLPGSYDWRPGNDYQNSSRFFTCCRVATGTVWYRWYRYDCLAGYDLATRRFVGSLGPGGFSPELPRPLENSVSSMQPGASPTAATFETTNAVYAVDFERRATRQIFSTGPERILGAADLLSPNAEWLYTVLATDQSVIVLDPKGKLVLKQAFKPARRYNHEVKVSCLEPPGQFALWVPHDPGTNWPGGGTPTTLVTWFGRDQGVTHSTELAALPPLRQSFNLREHVLSAALPPVALVASPLITEQVWPWRIPKEMFRTGLIAALLCLPAVWWLAWRQRFSFGAKAVWSGFILLTGIPGLLAFLSAQEWPAREPCHKCGKLRVVDRELCEHCGVEFPPPEKVGTEIFEPLPTAQG